MDTPLAPLGIRIAIGTSSGVTPSAAVSRKMADR
jgi:hypothetical protein